MLAMANYDLVGDILIVKFDRRASKREKLNFAREFLKKNNVKSVFEKTDKVSGRLRTIKTKFIAGENKKETVHHENSCSFKLNIEECYFSPRLSEDRKEVASMVKKKDKVLVMFAGVGPYPCVIAKKSGCHVTSIELGKSCCKYALENVRRNKLLGKIEVLQGDVKKIIKRKGNKGGLIVKGNWVPLQFDVIVMPRANLKETFLKEAFSIAKKGTRFFFHSFGQIDKRDKDLKEIHDTAKKFKRKIKIERIKKAGDIAPYTYRWRIDFIIK